MNQKKPKDMMNQKKPKDMMEQKVVFKIKWIDLKVIAVATRMVLVEWNEERGWMEKSIFNRLSAYYEQQTGSMSQIGTKSKIRPVYGLITERVDRNGKAINVFETLKQLMLQGLREWVPPTNTLSSFLPIPQICPISGHIS